MTSSFFLGLGNDSSRGNLLLKTPWTKRISAALVFAISISGAAAEEIKCPTSEGGTEIRFPDGSILMTTGLEVNPDGAVASYMPGDHGYTYIANGVNLIENGHKASCTATRNVSRCRTKWLAAEEGDFGLGTPEFCVFAMEVKPLDPQKEKVACELPKEGRFVVGNGKGRPELGAAISNVSGASEPTYVSTTALQHTRDGKIVYVDSAAIPGLVVPTFRSELVGAIAWVRYGNHEGFAIVNDTGPAFGEGSVALHQLLRTGVVGPLQPVGPIPTELRCSAVETDLRGPFVSRPDLGQRDICIPGHTAEGPSDIRAYKGVEEGVISIIMSKVTPSMKGWTVQEELTPDRLRQLASAAGYSQKKLHQMANCLRQ
jgi:hypothetical protein